MLFDEPVEKADLEEVEEEDEEEDNEKTRIVRKIWDSATGAFRKIVKKIG